MRSSIEEVQDKVRKYGALIYAPESLLAVRSTPAPDGAPYVKIDERYHYIVSERGVEFSRKSTTSANELLFWIMEGVASKMAIEFELNHRVAGKDSRRIYFSKLVELMKKMNFEWEGRIKAEIDKILQRSPYTDK